MADEKKPGIEQAREARLRAEADYAELVASRGEVKEAAATAASIHRDDLADLVVFAFRRGS